MYRHEKETGLGFWQWRSSLPLVCSVTLGKLQLLSGLHWPISNRNGLMKWSQTNHLQFCPSSKETTKQPNSARQQWVETWACKVMEEGRWIGIIRCVGASNLDHYIIGNEELVESRLQGIRACFSLGSFFSPSHPTCSIYSSCYGGLLLSQ